MISSAVGEQLMNLVDLRAELVELCDRAELAVDVAGVVDLLAEEVDSRLIDGAGDGKAGP